MSHQQKDIPKGYEAYKDKMSVKQYNIMCRAARETFDFFDFENEEWDAAKKFLQDKNKMHVDEKNNLSIYERGRTVTIDGQHFNQLYVDDVHKHIQDIFADLMLNWAKYRFPLPQRGRARSNSSAGLEEFSNNYFKEHDVPSVVKKEDKKKGGGGKQFLAPPGNQGKQVLGGSVGNRPDDGMVNKKGKTDDGSGDQNTPGNMPDPYDDEVVSSDDEETPGGDKIQVRKDNEEKSIGRLYRNNNMVRSSLMNLDEIAEALYDNIDELMDYVREQDDLIANQLEQISYLEREIENAANRFRPRRRRRRYGRDDIYYC